MIALSDPPREEARAFIDELRRVGVRTIMVTGDAAATGAAVARAVGIDGREGRVGFQRLLTYTFNMLVKKIEIVLFLATGLALTGNAVMTPALMVFLFLTNDFLSMSLTTDRASPARSPSVWRMGSITRAAIGVCKLAFSTSVLAFGKFRLGLDTTELQTPAFAALVFGNQAVLYVLRERRSMWSSKPGLVGEAFEAGAGGKFRRHLQLGPELVFRSPVGRSDVAERHPRSNAACLGRAGLIRRTQQVEGAVGS